MYGGVGLPDSVFGLGFELYSSITGVIKQYTSIHGYGKENQSYYEVDIRYSHYFPVYLPIIYI